MQRISTYKPQPNRAHKFLMRLLLSCQNHNALPGVTIRMLNVRSYKPLEATLVLLVSMDCVPVAKEDEKLTHWKGFVRIAEKTIFHNRRL